MIDNKIEQVKILKDLAKRLQPTGVDNVTTSSVCLRDIYHHPYQKNNKKLSDYLTQGAMTALTPLDTDEVERLHKVVEHIANNRNIKILSYDVTHRGYLRSETDLKPPSKVEKFLSFILTHIFKVWFCIYCDTVNSNQRTECWKCKYNRLRAIWES